MRRYWPQLGVILAACVFCWPVFLGRIMSPADMLLLMLPWKHLVAQFPGFTQPHNPMLDPIQQYLPWRIYAVESVRSGLVPLWNPYAFLGTPFLANLQSTLLYPPNLLFLVTGAACGFGVSAILHLTLGGLLTFAFLRTLRLREPAALLGALVFMFNGYTVSWLEYPTLSLWTLMWLPGILLCYERALQRYGSGESRAQGDGRLRGGLSVWPLLCALLVGMQFLGGHLQISAYLMLAFSVYAITRAIALRRPALALGLLIVPIVLGLTLAAGQILPTLELARYSGRVSHGPALTTALPLGHLVLYLVPNFFGNPAHYNYWGNYRDPSAFNFFETAAYVGILPLVLAGWSLRRYREPSFWFFAGLTVLAVLAALGTPVYLLLYHAIPGFHELAGLGRVLCLAAFGLAGLSALGLDELLAPQKVAAVGRGLVAFSAAAAVFVLTLWFVYGPIPTSAIQGPTFGDHYSPYAMIQLVAFFVLLAVSLGLVVLRARVRISARVLAPAALGVLVVDLFGFGTGFNPFVDSKLAYPETESLRWLQQHAGHERVTSLAPDDPGRSLDWMPHNASMAFGLRDVHGSDSLAVGSSSRLVTGPDLAQMKYPPPESSLLNTLAVRYLLTDRAVSRRWRKVQLEGPPIYENQQVQPRARLSGAGGGEICPLAGP